MNKKNLAKSLLLFVVSINAYSAEYKLDESHTQIGFKVKHLVISTVSGRFNKFSGNIKYDPVRGDLEGAKIVINSNSIDTNEPDRDKHLKSEDFFDVTKFPTIEFTSKKTVTKNKIPTELIGDLTIHGIKKEVKLKIESFGQTKDSWGNERIAFEAATKVDRKFFDLKWNKSLDQGGVMISDEVKIIIEGEAIKVQEEKK
jgi:polyisoprenoid-binding protein YceI